MLLAVAMHCSVKALEVVCFFFVGCPGSFLVYTPSFLMMSTPQPLEVIVICWQSTRLFVLHAVQRGREAERERGSERERERERESSKEGKYFGSSKDKGAGVFGNTDSALQTVLLH